MPLHGCYKEKAAACSNVQQDRLKLEGTGSNWPQLCLLFSWKAARHTEAPMLCHTNVPHCATLCYTSVLHCACYTVLETLYLTAAL